MGSRRISNATNEKIIALMSIGKTAESTAFATGCSSSYCNKLWTTTKYIANAQWDELIKYSRSATTGGGDRLGLRIPQHGAAEGSRGGYQSHKISSGTA